jgi:glycosyltransferase involved in cell wall biosynthesis
MTRAPAVLQVLPRLETGGVERGTVEVTSALVQAGWTAVVASAGGRMKHDVENVGGKHITLPVASKNPLTMLHNIWHLMNVIRHEGISLVHARSRAPAWSAYYAAKFLQTPFVTTFHNAYAGRSALKLFYNGIMAKGSRVIAISEFVAEHVRLVYGVGNDRLRVIPRGVDTQRFNPDTVSTDRSEALRQAWKINVDKPIIMLPGRLTRWKGQDVFINALAKLGHHNFQAVIVGSGDENYRQELVSLIEKLRLSDYIKIVDECDDMPAAFALTDFMVSASTRPEGFGRVIVEAAAMGCIVIATDHGGAKETIIDGATGWLVPSSDSQALASALQRGLDLSDDERQIMASRANNHVRQNYTTDLMTARTLDVYRELLNVS